jgi:putative peptidoglycan lipid II flippase
MPTNSFLKSTLILSLIGILFQFVGVFFMIEVARIFGANSDVDAYYYVLGFYFFVILVFQNVLKITLMPILIYERENNKESILTFNNVLLSYAFLFITVITLLIVFISQTSLISYLIPQNSSIELYRQLFLFSAPILLLHIIYSILSLIYNSTQKFGFLEFILNLRIVFAYIILLIFYSKFGTFTLIIGNVIGQFMVVMVALFYLQKIKLIKFKFEFKYNQALINISRLSLISLFAGLFNAAQPIISNYFLGNFSPGGSLTILSNLQKVASIPSILFTSSFMTVFLSHISRLEVESNFEKIRNTVTKSLSAISTVILPVILIMFITKDEIMFILFNNTKLTVENLETMSFGLVIFLISFYFIQIYSLLFRIFIAKKLLRIILFFNFISFIVHFFLTFLFVNVLNLNVIGTVCAMCFSNLFIAVFSFAYLNYKFKFFNLGYIVKNYFKTTLSLLIIFLLTKGLYNQFLTIFYDNNLIVVITFSIFIFLLYVIFLNILRQDDLLYIKKILLSKVNKFASI